MIIPLWELKCSAKVATQPIKLKQAKKFSQFKTKMDSTMLKKLMISVYTNSVLIQFGLDPLMK